MTRGQWILECAARFHEVAGTDHLQSMQLAETQLDDCCEGDLTSDPVEAADDEMDCWTND